MADPDPFADPAFVSRLQKLLSMLGTQQPGEAEAARRKLLEHLAGHRLSLTDLAQRLPTGRPQSGAQSGASFMQGVADMGLERQLGLARTARQEAEGDTRRAMQRVAELQLSLRDAASDLAAAIAAQARVRLLAASGWLVAGIVGALAITQHLHTDGIAQGEALVASGEKLLRPDPPSQEILRLSPGEQLGTVLVQDLPVRLSPSDDAGIRAFLNRGMRVVVEQRVRIGTQGWLLIRSVTGSGWVPAGDVLR